MEQHAKSTLNQKNEAHSNKFKKISYCYCYCYCCCCYCYCYCYCCYRVLFFWFLTLQSQTSANNLHATPLEALLGLKPSKELLRCCNKTGCHRAREHTESYFAGSNNDLIFKASAFGVSGAEAELVQHQQ